MIDAPTLIALIKSVRADDTAALDALDIYVSNFLGHPLPRCYTRSRNVTKAIRPEGFRVKIELWPYCVSAMGCFFHENRPTTTFESGSGPTEELCELYVII